MANIIRVQGISRYFIFGKNERSRFIELLPHSPITPGTKATFVADEYLDAATFAPKGATIDGKVCDWRMQSKDAKWYEPGSIVIDTKR